MWGAIIGDLIGSIYEYEQAKKFHKLDLSDKNLPDELITKESFFSDDTILTIAALDAILNNGSYEEYLKLYAIKYEDNIPKDMPYFKKMFSRGFLNWVKTGENNNSTGNGALMRLSPVAYLFNDYIKLNENIFLLTNCSHHSSEALSSAYLMGQIIYYARKRMTKDEIIDKLNIKIEYKDFDKFNISCFDTIGNCLYALFTSDSYIEAVKKVISYGGDTDTNACITGAMAEAMYTVDDSLIEKAKEKLPDEFISKLDKGYSLMKNMK